MPRAELVLVWIEDLGSTHNISLIGDHQDVWNVLFQVEL
jgi:hypothetical protein